MGRLKVVLSDLARAFRDQRREGRLRAAMHARGGATLPLPSLAGVTLISRLPRDVFVDLLPTRPAVAAEIGVARGNFTRKVLTLGATRKLHLIDPWVHQDDPAYAPDKNNASAEEQERRFRANSRRFAGHVRAGAVEIHREFSTDAVRRFADGYFDWVYVDAVHTFDGALGDLEAFAPKVKADGFILGHDFSNCTDSRASGFGVVEAVDAFIARQGWHFVALSLERYSTFVLARDPASEAVRRFASNLIRIDRSALAVRGFRGASFLQQDVGREGSAPIFLNLSGG